MLAYSITMLCVAANMEELRLRAAEKKIRNITNLPPNKTNKSSKSGKGNDNTRRDLKKEGSMFILYSVVRSPLRTLVRSCAFGPFHWHFVRLK